MTTAQIALSVIMIIASLFLIVVVLLQELSLIHILTGRTCLAGDVIGEYSFDVPLMAGEQVVFEDMALYTMVKTNTFNGMPLPLIAVRRADGTDEVVRMFSYEDFKNRLS